jgi:malonyl-CoA O-methyltransferase
VNKELIQARFKRALDRYDQHAGVQADSASRLLAMVQARLGGEFPRVLEIGCGTGLLTRRLLDALRVQDLYVNDLVPECSHHLPRGQASRLHFIPGDAELFSEWPADLDLVVSNATFQWLLSPGNLFPTLARALKPGAGLAFAVFGPENCRELAGTLGVGLSYRSPKQWQELAAGDFDCLAAEERETLLVFPGPRDVLRHLQNLGVNSLADWRWRKDALRDWETRYRGAYAVAGGVRLTQKVLYFIFRKRGRAS